MATAPIDIPVKVKGLSDLDKLVKRMNVLENEVSRLNKKLPAAANGIRNTGRAAKSAAGGVNTLNAAFAKIAVVIGTVTAAVGAFNVSVARTESERKIKILADAYGEAAQLADIAARASEKFGNSQTETNNALATTYARLRPVGVGLADISSIYGGFNTAARLAGASAIESTNAFRQLAQALGSGALRGDEFRSVAEQAPLVLQAVSKETGIAVGELRDFAAQGGITADIVIKALKRIEKEGAGQLAESLKGPQQAIKNFQNAFEDLGAELGKLGEPALISFFNNLTAVTKSVTANMDKLAKVAQTLIDVIYKPFSALVAGIAETGPKMEGFGNTVMQVIGMSMKIFEDFANFMTPVFNVIGKVLGQAITWFWEFAKGVAGAISGAAKAVVAGVRVMANAIAKLINSTPIGALSKLFGFDLGGFAVGPLNALANGLGDVGSAVVGYVDSVRQAGREFAASSEKVTAPVSKDYAPSTLASPNAKSKGGGGKGGGSGKAAADAAKALEDQKKQLLAAQDLLFAAQETNKVLAGRTELQTAYLEANKKMNEIEREYAQLVSEALSNEEIAILNKAKGVELTNAQLELDKQISDLREDAVGSIQEDIELMKAKLNGTEKELIMRREIAALTKNGSVSKKEATSLVQTRNALEKQIEAQDKAKASAEQLSGAIADSLTSSLRGLVDGSKSAKEALSDAFKGIADAFLDMAMQMIQEWLKMQVIGLVGSLFGGSPVRGVSPNAIKGAGASMASGLMGYADGGRPTPGKLSIVGEEGPELFLPDTAGTIIPNDAFADARGAMGIGSASDSSDDSDELLNGTSNYYSQNGDAISAAEKAYAQNTNSIMTSNSVMRDRAIQREEKASLERAIERNSETTIGGGGSMVIETQVINSTEYATIDQVQKVSAASARQARAQVFSDMKNKPAIRAKAGLR